VTFPTHPTPAAAPRCSAAGVGCVLALRRRGERGAVTAETVMVLPVLVALTLGLAWLLSLASAQVRVVDAAREVARAVARDDSRASALALGRRVAPGGSRFTVRQRGDTVVVRVQARVNGPQGLLGFLPAAHVDGEAVAARERR
jgi:Flp pilus assembly protein TadG